MARDADQIVEEFVAFCLERRGCYEWPSLYDEMCWVASQRLFRDMGYTELREQGISLSLTNVGRLQALARRLAA